MSRSNAPLALSVVSLTEPGDVKQTLSNITQFDDRRFGFSHDQTWAALPYALKGVLNPEAVAKSFPKTHPRVQQCITALCLLGQELKLETRRFVDFPAAGLRTIAPIDWDPEVTVRVKGCCWYVESGQVNIPLLQPRKSPLSVERLSVYLRLAKQAYCRGDWVDANVQLIDLAGDAVEAVMLGESEIGLASDSVLTEFVKTYVEAKRAADVQRAKRPKQLPAPLPLEAIIESGLKS